MIIHMYDVYTIILLIIKNCVHRRQKLMGYGMYDMQTALFIATCAVRSQLISNVHTAHRSHSRRDRDQRLNENEN